MRSLLLALTLFCVSYASQRSHTGHLRHVVLIAFQEGTGPEQIAAAEQQAAELADHIPEILAYEWGTDITGAEIAAGFTHCLFVTFADNEGLQTYLPHPAHQAFVERHGPHFAKVLVVDYLARD
ncbi:MAG: hypothetical protein ACI8QC_002424 [Planctomycetota bacterium]|jgi:hypothetical protein